MNRSLATSVFLSIVLHLALILALLSIKYEPPINGQPSVVYFTLQQLDDGDDLRDQHAGETASNKSADARISIEATERIDSEPTIVEVDEIVSVPENRAIDATERLNVRTYTEPTQSEVLSTPVLADTPPEGRESLLDNSDALTTIAEIDRTIPPNYSDFVPPAPETVSIAHDQQVMLSERFRTWAESYDRMDQSELSIAWEYEGQGYTATFQRLPVRSDTDIDQVIIEVSTHENGKTLSTEMRMKRLAFSNFAQFVDRWDPNVQIHDDEIDGRFHSNSEIYLGYSRSVKPSFHGKVTTAFRRINTANSRGRVSRDEMFLGGLETGVRRIALPKHYLPFPGDTTFHEDQVQYFEEDTRITFYPDGTYGWQLIDSTAPEQRRPLSGRSSYILGVDKAELHVKGVIKGKVLVYSPQRIIIEADLVYAHDPKATPDADNYLGLVSGKSVEIADSDVTGPGDLLIHAAIYAKRRFVIRNYRARENATLFIYGSLTAGSVSATEPRFSTRIQFDKRLENMRPPSFPMTNRYELESWDRMWQRSRPPFH